MKEKGPASPAGGTRHVREAILDSSPLNPPLPTPGGAEASPLHGAV